MLNKKSLHLKYVFYVSNQMEEWFWDAETESAEIQVKQGNRHFYLLKMTNFAYYMAFVCWNMNSNIKLMLKLAKDLPVVGVLNKTSIKVKQNKLLNLFGILML